jgi:hypothetical protein
MGACISSEFYLFSIALISISTPKFISVVNIFTITLSTILKYNYVYKFYKIYTEFDVVMNDISEWNTHVYENYINMYKYRFIYVYILCVYVQ